MSCPVCKGLRPGEGAVGPVILCVCPQEEAQEPPIDLFNERLRRTVPDLRVLFEEYRDAVDEIESWNDEADRIQNQITSILVTLIQSTHEELSTLTAFEWFKAQGYSKETLKAIREMFASRLGPDARTKKPQIQIIAEALSSAFLTILMESEEEADPPEGEGGDAA